MLETIEAFEPDVIVTHSCGALWDDTLIVMDAEQTVATAKAAPRATVIATHMEALDHSTVGRDALPDSMQPHTVCRPDDCSCRPTASF